ncbi:MAG: cytochrome b [Steroidobacteraceae bacterium]
MPGQGRAVSAARYDGGAMTLHWVMVVLVVVVGVLGLLHDSWPRATQAFWINVHALVGLAVWALVMVRLGWRRVHPPPALPVEVGEFSRRWSYPVHLLLYALMLVIPILGIVTFLWHGRVFDLGLFRVDFGVHKNRAIFHPTEEVHGYLAYALFTLIGLHTLAALWHHFVRRDGVLQRMWPARRGSA